MGGMCPNPPLALFALLFKHDDDEDDEKSFITGGCPIFPFPQCPVWTASKTPSITLMLQITVGAFSCNIQTFCTVCLIHEALCVNTFTMSCMKMVSKMLCLHLNYYFFYSIKALSFLGPNSTDYYEVGWNMNHNKISNLGFKESRQFSPVWPSHWY